MNWSSLTGDDDDGNEEEDLNLGPSVMRSNIPVTSARTSNQFNFLRPSSFVPASNQLPTRSFTPSSYTPEAFQDQQPMYYQHQGMPNASGFDTSFNPNDVTFQGIIELEGATQATKPLFRVEFNRVHKCLFQANRNLKLNPGDYVLTEADRGYDIGRVIEIVRKPSLREFQNCKNIIRKATQHEFSQLPLKAAREQRALEICRAKVAEFGMPMNVVAAEFQFDGNKLTFYYEATYYIDFRALVKDLFKIFQIRIWMQTCS